MLYIGIAVTVALVDILLKNWIVKADAKLFPMEVCSGKIKVKRVYNSGLMFGVLSKEQEFVKKSAVIMTSLTSLVALITVFSKKAVFLSKCGISLILGGAVSNLYDRLKRGRVVDYINLHQSRFQKIKTLVFNIGDAAIMTGSFLLLLRSLFHKKAEKSV